MGYGTGQRAAFAGLLIGFLLCATGAIAPFWQEGKVTVNTIAKIFGETLPVDLTLVSMFGGLWWYCVDALGERKCDTYDLEHDNAGRDWVIRIACVANVLLTLICALAALCRTCCCAGGKTICHGIMAFIAGAAGIVTVGVFAATASEGYGMKLNLLEYGWAFYVYIGGVAVVTVVSFLLCFASPDNPFRPVIISSVNHMLPNSQYTRMPDERVLIDEGGRSAQVNYPHGQNY